MAKLNFQHHYSSLQCHMILQKTFKRANLVLKKHFLLLIMLKTVVLLSTSCGNHDTFFRILQTECPKDSSSSEAKHPNMILFLRLKHASLRKHLPFLCAKRIREQTVGGPWACHLRLRLVSFQLCWGKPYEPTHFAQHNSQWKEAHGWFCVFWKAQTLTAWLM